MAVSAYKPDIARHHRLAGPCVLVGGAQPQAIIANLFNGHGGDTVTIDITMPTDSEIDRISPAIAGKR